MTRKLSSFHAHTILLSPKDYREYHFLCETIFVTVILPTPQFLFYFPLLRLHFAPSAEHYKARSSDLLLTPSQLISRFAPLSVYSNSKPPVEQTRHPVSPLPIVSGSHCSEVKSCHSSINTIIYFIPFPYNRFVLWIRIKIHLHLYVS